MSVVFYMDEHIHGVISEQLRARGVDVLTTQEDRREGTPDNELLARARELGRVMFSMDADMLREARLLQKAGRPFAGLAHARQLGITVGEAIESLELLAQVSDLKDIANSAEYLPL